MAPNANPRKRAIETVDLTGDQADQPMHKTPRSSQNDVVMSSQPTQSQRDAWIEEDAHETILLSQEGNDGVDGEEEYELYGKIKGFILGLFPYAF